MNSLPILNLPPQEFKFQIVEGKLYIYDDFRRKYVVLTPEEWVRQNFLRYLINYKNYPKSLVRLEGGLVVDKMRKRSDILIFNNLGEKILLVECKAPNIKLTQQAFNQVANYNVTHKVPFIAITNGLQHYCCEINHNDNSYAFLKEIPDYKSLISK